MKIPYERRPLPARPVPRAVTKPPTAGETQTSYQGGLTPASAAIVAKRDAKTAAKKAANPVDKFIGSRVRMRRMMLAMSQEKLGDALGLTFQQVQKYEKGTNRIGGSRMLQIANILQVPVAFFYEGAPVVGGATNGGATPPSPAYVSDFLATSMGLATCKAFMRLREPKLQRRFLDLLEETADQIYPEAGTK